MLHAEVVEDTGQQNDAYCYREPAADILACCVAFPEFVLVRQRAGGDGSEQDSQAENESRCGEHCDEAAMQCKRSPGTC
jgi:hypothetical protein